jgi:hypothetical protein
MALFVVMVMSFNLWLSLPVICSWAELAKRAGDNAQYCELMERFVRTFETRWGPLIEWYAAESNEEKSLEWNRFAVERGDLNRALPVAAWYSVVCV